MLKKTLKNYTTTKVINYNNNFLDIIEMEKGVFIKEDNGISELVEEFLEPWLDDWKIIEMQLESGCWLEYNFDSLPKKLKDYMYVVDSLLYERWYNSLNPSNTDYDSRLTKLEVLIPDYTDEEFNHYVVLGNPLPTPLGKKARDSARRTYKTVNELIKCNVDKFKHFITLTFADEKRKERHLELNDRRKEGEASVIFKYIDATDFDLCKRKYTQFMDKLKQRLKEKGISLEYIAVWELQGNGHYHFHILSTEIPIDEMYLIPEWLDYNHLKKERYNGYGLKKWKYGKSDIQEIKNKARLTTYVSKYIIKSFQNVNPDTYEEYLNKKKYFVTTGLNRPVINYMLDDIDYELNEPYIKEYINPYNNGLITKKQYTLV